jgi:hypothetical protein
MRTEERTIIYRDGREVATVPGDPMEWFHQQHSFSMDHALKHEGYSLSTEVRVISDRRNRIGTIRHGNSAQGYWLGASGHGTPNMTTRYTTTPSPEEVAAEVARWAERLAETAAKCGQ